MGARGSVLVSYFDSSSLVRFLLREGEQAAIERGMAGEPTTSDLGRLEIRAAIHARRRQGALAPREADALIRKVDDELLASMTLFPIDEDVLAEAIGVVAEHALRSLDSIHLGTAIIADRLVRRHGADLVFCTADRRQAMAAAELFGPERVTFIPPWR